MSSLHIHRYGQLADPEGNEELPVRQRGKNKRTTLAALKNRTQAGRGARTTAAIGTSITAHTRNVDGGNQIANSTIVTSRAYLRKALAQCGNPSRLIAEKGVGGNRLDEMLARYKTDILSHNPGHIIVEGISNDVDFGHSADQAFESLYEMYRQARWIDAQFLYIGTTAMSRNLGAKAGQVNRMRNLCRMAMLKLPGFSFYDLAVGAQSYSGSVAGTSYGSPLTVPVNAVDDGTHPTSFGTTAVAPGFAAFLAAWYRNPQWDRLGINSNNGGNNYDESNLIVNSLMAGNAGTVGAGCTGVAPDSMEVTKSGAITSAGSLVDRTDGGPGRWWKHDISGATQAADYVRAGIGYSAPNGSPALTAALVGKLATTQVELDVSVTSGYITVLKTVARFKSATSAILATVIWGEPFKAGEFDYITSFKGAPQSPEFVIPAGSSVVEFFVFVQTSVGAQVAVKMTGLEIRADTYSQLFI